MVQSSASAFLLEIRHIMFMYMMHIHVHAAADDLCMAHKCSRGDPEYAHDNDASVKCMLAKCIGSDIGINICIGICIRMGS